MVLNDGHAVLERPHMRGSITDDIQGNGKPDEDRPVGRHILLLPSDVWDLAERMAGGSSRLDKYIMGLVVADHTAKTGQSRTKRKGKQD